MSWAAHELESYFLQEHLKSRFKTKISYLAVLLGCLLPDLLTKLPVYGLNIGNMTLIKAGEPWKYHRGWPGVGPTHSLLFIVLVSLLLLAWKKNRAWAFGLLIGGVAHVLTDCFDSVGTMLFFPFTTQLYSTGMWAYAAQAGRYGDASAYYSSLEECGTSFGCVSRSVVPRFLHVSFFVRKSSRMTQLGLGCNASSQ